MSHAPARESAPSKPASYPGRGAGRIALGLVLLAVVVLGAMAVVGATGGRAVGRLQERAESVIEPASEIGTRLAALHAREMVALQTFLLSGSPSDRLRYREALDRSQAMEDSLAPLAESLGTQVQEAFFFMADAAFRWRSQARPVLDEEVTREAFVTDLPHQRNLFSALQNETLALEAAIAAQAGGVRNLIAAEQERQRAATLMLSGLALLAALGLAGVALHLQSLARDMARRRQDAARARAETSAVLNAAADGVLGLDRSGRCTFINRAAAGLLGVDLHGSLGRGANALIQGEGVVSVLSVLGSEEPEVGPAEVIIADRAGGTFPARITSHPVRGGGSSLARVVTIADMTRERQAADELRRAVSARERVMAVVSHDLRNPLGTVQAASELLIELDLPPHKVEEQLRIIHRSAERMAGLIRDLLDVSVMESGGFFLRSGTVDLEGLLSTLVGESQGLARGRGASVEIDVAGEARGCSFEGDADRLLQALLNLVGNALKFSPSGTTVRVGTSVDAEGSQPILRVTVDDQGPGVPEDLRDTLFEPFRQGEVGDARGAGLGLAIVRGIVTAHGGSVRVADAPGGGARFAVSLPMHPAVHDPVATPGAG